MRRWLGLRLISLGYKVRPPLADELQQEVLQLVNAAEHHGFDIGVHTAVGQLLEHQRQVAEIASMQ